MSCAPWKYLKSFWTDHEVTPTVIVRSPWLRIPELSSFCIMSMATIVYLIYHLQAIHHENVAVWPLVEFRPPMKNFWNCSTAMGTCEPDYVKPNTSAYCKKTGHYSCRVFSEYELTEGLASTSELAVALSETTFREQCPVKSDPCPGWKKDNSSVWRHYVDDVEGNLVRIRTYIKTAHWSTAGSDVQSLLKFKGTGKIKRLVPHGLKLMDLVDVPQKNFFNSTYKHTCGNDTGGRDSCVGTAYGDYISLGILLEAANVTMNETMREKGFVLHLVCRYSNVDRDDFWAWPWGFKPKLVYEPELGRYTESDAVLWTEREPRSGNTRDITSKAALSIRLVPQGAHGTFDLYTLASKLVIAASLLSFAQWFVNNVLTKIYSQLTSLKHVSILYELSSKKATKGCSWFAGNATPKDVLDKLGQGGILTTFEDDEDFEEDTRGNSKEYTKIPFDSAPNSRCASRGKLSFVELQPDSTRRTVLLGSEKSSGRFCNFSVQPVDL